VKRKEYVYLLSDTDRKRHIHSRTGRKIIDFLVQYEALTDGKWVPVVRYDTAHGYAHKDILNPDGSKQKVILGEHAYEAALSLADLDINQNWKAYKARYMRRLAT
jgi:hypothetical protein